MSKYLDKFVNKIKLLKFLHDPKDRQQCVDLFNDKNNQPTMTERTIRNYINEGDIEIDNVIIPFQIQRIEHSQNQFSDSENTFTGYGENQEPYRSTVHPVILPLNLTEIYMLTNGLLDIIGTNHPQYDTYKDISSKIYLQLSDYAKRRIPATVHGLETEGKVTFISESEMIEKNYLSIIGKSMKLNKKVRVTTITNEEYIGVIRSLRNNLCIEDRGHRIIISNLGIKNIEIL